MKSSIFFLFLFCASIGWAQTETIDNLASLSVTYEIDANFKKNITNPMMLELQKAVRRGEMVLYCNKFKCSSFIPTPYNPEVESDLYAFLAIGGHTSYYEQLSPPHFVEQKIWKEQLYLIENDARPVWEIQDTSTFINGIFCLYATGIIPSVDEGFAGTKVTAWFAPEFSFPFGPHRLTGLPGLVLKGSYSTLIYTAKEIHLFDKEKHLIVMPTRGEKIKSIIEFTSKMKR